MGHYNDHNKKTGGKFVLGAIFGAIAGAIAALLTAPKSGKETREDLKDKANEYKDDAVRQLRKLEGELNKKMSDVRRVAHKLEGTYKDQADALLAKAEAIKDRTLASIEKLKKDADSKLDEKLTSDVKDVIAKLDELRDEINEAARKK